jgi:hypothetical protein
MTTREICRELRGMAGFKFVALPKEKKKVNKLGIQMVTVPNPTFLCDGFSNKGILLPRVQNDESPESSQLVRKVQEFILLKKGV